jgi:gluconolactonase
VWYVAAVVGRWPFLFTSVVVIAGCAAPRAGGSPTATPSNIRPAPAAVATLSAFAGSERPHRVASEIAFESLEGPIWIARGNYLLFSDVVEQNAAGARIYRYDPVRQVFAIEPYPGPATSTNGLAVDPAGNLLACERYNGALVRIAGGSRVVIADRFPMPDGPTLNAPNDLAVRGDGNIYFTDTVWGARPGLHAGPAVYRVAPAGDISLAYAVPMPNGIALSPNGRTLYVGSDAANRVWRLPIDEAGAVGASTVLIDADRVPGGAFKVPDGICIDDDGDLYVANNDDAVRAIEVFDPAGDYLGSIALPDRPSNCTFGGADRRTLFVTTPHAIYEARVQTAGLP